MNVHPPYKSFFHKKNMKNQYYFKKEKGISILTSKSDKITLQSHLQRILR